MLDPVMVGQVLREYREKRGLSQEVASGLAGIGRTHLSAIERGLRRPTIDTFYRICYALNVKASEVMAEIEQKQENL